MASLGDGKGSQTCLRFLRWGFGVTLPQILRNGKSEVFEAAVGKVVQLLGFVAVKFCAGGGVVSCKMGARLADFASHGQETETFKTAPA